MEIAQYTSRAFSEQTGLAVAMTTDTSLGERKRAFGQRTKNPLSHVPSTNLAVAKVRVTSCYENPLPLFPRNSLAVAKIKVTSVKSPTLNRLFPALTKVFGERNENQHQESIRPALHG